MKTFVRVLILAVVALLLVVHVNLNLNGNKVEGLKLSTNTQVAEAGQLCSYSLEMWTCYCGPYFGAVCGNGCGITGSTCWES